MHTFLNISVISAINLSKHKQRGIHMNISKPLIFILLVCSLFTTIPAVAQQQISGSQSGTLGPGTYIVIGNIQVPANQTLTILPNTEFLHSGYYTWTIYGKLIAQGTEMDSIRFVRQNPTTANRWGGIRFNTTASYGIFEYCTIDNCQNNGIYTNDVNITVRNSRISNCTASTGGGIYAYSANLTVENCVIFNNVAGNGGGVSLYNCTEVVIRNCIIAQNKSTST
jgi:hypothetical protein